MHEEARFLEIAAPFIGLGVGGLAAFKGGDLVGASPAWASWGTAAIGTVGAIASDGWFRNAAIGVAAAGASVAILRLMGVLDESEGIAEPVAERRQADPLEPAEHEKSAAPPDAITQAALQKAIAGVTEQHESQMKALDTKYGEQMQALRTAYESRIGEICAGFNQRLSEKDQMISQLLHQPHTEQPASVGPRLVPRDAAAPASAEAPAADSTETAPAQPLPELAAKAQAVTEMLTPEENAQVEKIFAGLPPATLAIVQSQLAKRSPEEAVAYLRRCVLTPREAA